MSRPTSLCRASRRWRYLQLRDAGLDEISSWRLAADITIDLHRFIEDLEDGVVDILPTMPAVPSMIDDTAREETDAGRHGRGD